LPVDSEYEIISDQDNKKIIVTGNFAETINKITQNCYDKDSKKLRYYYGRL
jgi:hypothetical protein